ncbi:hypothetical protein [Miltoncostaea oceani]|uniref:hypothetical protein n=1 Tax=Miltoncostaea oceani TaxID=2843216 RepID=UPI001C3CCA35|nr:hypothetical protein [Miltoncostaea oceani]
MPTYPAVRAFHVFDLVAKTFGPPRADLEHALCYELTSVEAPSPEAACEAAFTHSNAPEIRPSGYDGPSLSMGDLVEVDTPEGRTLTFRCQSLGFALVADPEIVVSSRLSQPPAGGWVAPRLDLASKALQPGTTWLPWIVVSERAGRD